MSELKQCPCGETPKTLLVVRGDTCKWAFVTGGCCNEWHIEFRSNYLDIESPELMVRAEKAWNEAPRG